MPNHIILSAHEARHAATSDQIMIVRLLKPEPSMLNGGKPFNDGRGSYAVSGGWHRFPFSCGDRMAVKETWAQTQNTADQSDWPGRPCLRRDKDSPFDCVIWRADGPWQWLDDDGDETSRSFWKPPVTMPLWASRATLHFTEVTVKRVQDITEEEAIATGMIRCDPTEGDRQWARDNDYGDGSDMQSVWLAPGTRRGYGMTKDQRAEPQWGPTAAYAFKLTFTATHGPDAWASNPWCALGLATVERRA